MRRRVPGAVTTCTCTWTWTCADEFYQKACAFPDVQENTKLDDMSAPDALRTAPTFSTGAHMPDAGLPNLCVRPSAQRCSLSKGRCSFEGTTWCGMEWDVWVVARALLSPHHRVLELGARYGTTSCVLANLTGNRGRVVSAEPDPRVHNLLLHNRKVNSCSFHARGWARSAPHRSRCSTLDRDTGRAMKPRLHP